MNTININSTKELKDLIKSDPTLNGNRSLIIRNYRIEKRLYGQYVSTLFLVNGKYLKANINFEV